MGKQKYFLISGIIFSIVAALHLLRVVFDVGLIIGSWVVPQWLSAAAFAGAGFMAYMGSSLSRRT